MSNIRMRHMTKAIVQIERWYCLLDYGIGNTTVAIPSEVHSEVWGTHNLGVMGTGSLQ